MGKFFSGKVKLIAASVHRHESVGGFSHAKRENPHKSARRYVPAGSVYYFECVDKQVSFKQNLIQHAITDLGAEIGFGQVLIEEWNNV